jgi:hypothetical protein
VQQFSKANRAVLCPFAVEDGRLTLLSSPSALRCKTAMGVSVVRDTLMAVDYIAFECDRSASMFLIANHMHRSYDPSTIQMFYCKSQCSSYLNLNKCEYVLFFVKHIISPLLKLIHWLPLLLFLETMEHVSLNLYNKLIRL